MDDLLKNIKYKVKMSERWKGKPNPERDKPILQRWRRAMGKN